MISDKINEDLLKIFNYFGVEVQMSKLWEEGNELLEAIDMGTKDELLDEMADVWIISMQHYLNNEKMRKKVDEKIARTLKRIKENYYEVS